MKKVLVLNGGMRPRGNSGILAAEFVRGCKSVGAEVEEVLLREMNIKPCTGCLRCNTIKRCSIQNDDWVTLSARIAAADILVFVTPIYFHHVTAPMKAVLDRFRSFIHVRITQSGLIHTPWNAWSKRFVLITSMGSPDASESVPVKDLMHFMCEVLGSGNSLTVLEGTRLAVPGQVLKSREDLNILYSKMGIPEELAENDFERNKALLETCFEAGVNSVRS